MNAKTVVRNVVAGVTAVRARMADSLPAPATAETFLGLSFQPGDKAIDLVTGEVVTVDAGHEAADLAPPARPYLD